MRLSPWTLLAAALTLAACAGAGDDAVVDTAAGTAAAVEPMTLNLASQGNSGLTGEVRLTPRNGQVLVAAHVMGAAGEFVGQVHRGTCATVPETSTPVAEFGSVTLAAGAMMDHNGTLDVPMATLANGEHAILFRRGANGPVAACVEVPRT